MIIFTRPTPHIHTSIRVYDIRTTSENLFVLFIWLSEKGVCGKRSRGRGFTSIYYYFGNNKKV